MKDPALDPASLTLKLIAALSAVAFALVLIGVVVWIGLTDRRTKK